MSLTQPVLNAVAFAVNSSHINQIPTSTTKHGAASFQMGFPYETMVNKVAGGVPPSGRDMNGILNFLSQHQVWLNAGGVYKFNPELAEALDGYQEGAVLRSNDGMREYISLVDSNKTDPNTPGNTTWAIYSGEGSVAETANKWTNERTVSFLGAATGSFSLDGSKDVSCNLTLANSGVVPQTYGSNKETLTLTVNEKGLITALNTNQILDATTGQAGLVKLNDTLSSNSVTEALTANAGRVLNDEKAPKRAPIFLDKVDISKSGEIDVGLSIRGGQGPFNSQILIGDFVSNNGSSFSGFKIRHPLNNPVATFLFPLKNNGEIYTLATVEDVNNAVIGVGQTYVDVTSSRDSGTTYTNTTGRPIQIMITSPTGTADTALYIGGVQVGIARVSSSASFPITAIVPNNMTYRFEGNIVLWTELR